MSARHVQVVSHRGTASLACFSGSIHKATRTECHILLDNRTEYRPSGVQTRLYVRQRTHSHIKKYSHGTEQTGVNGSGEQNTRGGTDELA